MANGTELRGIALEILLEITQEKEYSHLAIRNALNKVQYLPKQDRAFINRLVEGTLEYMLRIDYVLNQFSSVRVNKMKPVIRNILRSGVYQLMFMDSVPDPAACNEAVKLAQKKGFYSLKGFVNGVMRNVARKKEEIIYPDKNRDPEEYLSVYYSVPQWLVKRWVQTYGTETTECMLKDFLTDHPLTIRCQLYRVEQELTVNSLKGQGATVEQAPYLPYAFYLSDYSHLEGLKSFVMGRFVVQDVSSMLVTEAADNGSGGNHCVHKAHGKSLGGKLAIKLFANRKMLPFRNQNRCFPDNIDQTENNGKSLRDDCGNSSTADTHLKSCDK